MTLRRGVCFCFSIASALTSAKNGKCDHEPDPVAAFARAGRARGDQPLSPGTRGADREEARRLRGAASLQRRRARALLAGAVGRAGDDRRGLALPCPDRGGLLRERGVVSRRPPELRREPPAPRRRHGGDHRSRRRWRALGAHPPRAASARGRGGGLARGPRGEARGSGRGHLAQRRRGGDRHARDEQPRSHLVALRRRSRRRGRGGALRADRAAGA